GGRALTLLDANRATLGLITTLNGGTLAAENGLFVDFDGNIVGRGTVQTANTASKASIINGAVVGDSLEHPITFTGYIKGVGTFDNVVFEGTYSPGLSPTQQFVGSVGLSADNHLIMEL